MTALYSVHVLVAIVVALWQLHFSFSQFPDTSDPCASSATQLHNGDIAYFPTFDYPTGSHQETATEGEGDEGRRKRAATSLDRRLWPGGVIYYQISDRYTDEENRTILEAMKHWEDHTCIRFQKRTTQRVYINIFPGSGCCSYVGRIGYGLQGVSVAKACLAFHTIVHELGHVIGFWHEQSRPDRDQYIEVVLANVIPGFEINFNKKAENEIDSQGVGYDYNSIMHYNRNFFARFSSFDTMLARDRSIPIGLARELSELDIIQTNRLYNCNVNNMPPPRIILPELPPTVPPTLPPLPFPSCGAVFVNATGSFSSPSYPSYTHNTDCLWMINGPVGHWIRLSFSPLRIEYSSNCQKDYIILERSFEESANPNRICSHYFSYRFSSHSNTVMIRYHTDGDNSADRRPAYGFHVSYESFDIDECYTAGCSQLCHNYPGSYSCSCRDGWFLSADGVTCFDTNECALESGGCEHHCTNTGGSYYCSCDDGFSLEPDGKRCRVPGTSCSFRNGGCSHHCNDTGVSRICSCDVGYSLRSDERTCRDIDECAMRRNSHGCQHSCVNTPGSYRCECNSGFLLGEDLHSCLPERTCATNNGGCSHSCRDSDDGAVCRCPRGYHLGSNQMTCEDTDECYNSRLCGHVCVNTNGSYHCECWEGYSLDSDGIFCRNIDECLDKSNFCQFKELCRDNHGSYTCRCPSGYTLNEDGHTCKDNDECAQGYHICSHTCRNLNGTYECTCPSGFTLQDLYTCRDVDECATGLHRCNLASGATCKNTDGSYECLCQEGYKKDDSGLMCVETATTTAPAFQIDTTTAMSNTGAASITTIIQTDMTTTAVNPAITSSIKSSTMEPTQPTQTTAANLATTFIKSTTEEPTQDEVRMATVNPTTSDSDKPLGTTTASDSTEVASVTETTTSDSVKLPKSTMVPSTETASTTEATVNLTTSDSDKMPITTIVSSTETTTATEAIATPSTSDFDILPITTTVSSTTDVVSTTEVTVSDNVCVKAGCEHMCKVKTDEVPVVAECFCPDGYILAQDGKTCEDVNECSDGNNGGCETYCRNLAGSYECLCRRGYLLGTDGRTCKDVNECEENNGGCSQTCNNIPGSFSCNCLPDYYLAIDGHTCIPFNPEPPPPTTTTTSSSTPSVPSTSPSPNKISSTTAPVTHTDTTTSLATGERPTQPLCGGNLRAANGTFQTLNWPETYPVNVDCEWSIEIPDSNKVIEITFDRSVFGIAGRLPNCEKDWLKVYDGPEASTEATSWGPFCHYRVPNKIKTSSHEAKVVFHAGRAHNPVRKGFKASYRSVERTSAVVQVLPQNPSGLFVCVGFLQMNSNFGPPEFPNLITSTTGGNCFWLAAGSSGRRYAFKLIYFNIPSSPNCRDNSLKVYSSYSRTQENLLATLCGDLSEEEMTIEGGNNFMTVVLEVRDQSVSFRGFYGYFEQQSS